MSGDASPAPHDAEARRRVRDFLLSRGVPEDEVAEGEAKDVLDLLVADRVVVPAPRRYTESDVAERTGMPVELARRFWRALGFPAVEPSDRVFTDLDVEALTTLRALIELRSSDASADTSADVETALQMTRVIGSSMARIAEAEVSPAVRTMLAGSDAADSVEAADRFAALAEPTLAAMARLLEFVWRRHVAAAVRRAMLQRTRGDSQAQPVLAVGFADMVGFTVLSQQLAEDELAAMVSRFEEVARDTVTAGGGRVVKMIGDEAMFVADTVLDAAHIGLALAEAYADDDLLSDVRVALAVGPVLVQDGDYYGPVVNLASRVVDIAQPGSVLVTDDFHHTLVLGVAGPGAVVPEAGGSDTGLVSAGGVGAGGVGAGGVGSGGVGSGAPSPEGGHDDTDAESEFTFKALRPRNIKGLGRVQLWVLHRAGGEEPTLERRLGRRWERLSEVLEDLDDLRERGERLITASRTGLRHAAALGERLPSSARGAEGGDLEGTERE